MGVCSSSEDIWKDAITLGELVFKMVQEKRIKTPEFEALEKCFGKEKLRELYLEEKRKRGK